MTLKTSIREIVYNHKHNEKAYTCDTCTNKILHLIREWVKGKDQLTQKDDHSCEDSCLGCTLDGGHELIDELVSELDKEISI